MELLGGGSLEDLMKERQSRDNPRGKLPPSECHRFFQQLVLGLDYCHQCLGLVHRDIKPANLLLDESRCLLKLADFGLARLIDEGRLGGTVGSSYFMAPEVTRGETHSATPSDVWASGVSLYYMAFG